MKTLKGFRDYIQTKMEISVFDELLQSGADAVLLRCDGTESVGRVTENSKYDLKFRPADVGEDLPENVFSKVEILLVFNPECRDGVYANAKIKGPEEIASAEPLHKGADRNYIKNKTLYTMMAERQVLEIKLLNGMVLKGLVAGFNLYEIKMNLKGGTPVVVLRHGVLSAQTKTGRSLLKADQDKLKDWKKSVLYVDVEQNC